MLLLVVLSLLVLFLMVGTAFVITAKQSERAAKAAQRGTLRLSTAAAMGDLLDDVMLQIVRDTNNPNSVLRFHSLLADMYGTDGFRARIQNAQWPSGGGVANTTGGQMLQFELVPGSLIDLSGTPVKSTPTATPSLVDDARFLSPLDNAYNGLVLTFLGGPCAGQSVRIVGYRPPDLSLPANDPLRNAAFTVMCPADEYGGALTDLTAMNAVPTSILVNGRPFTGTGFGLNPDIATMMQRTPAARLSLYERAELTGNRNRPVALLPNSVYFDPSQLSLSATGAPVATAPNYLLSPTQLASIATTGSARFNLAARIGPAGIGGANEGYDTVDFQNMGLALVPGVSDPNRLIETAVRDVSKDGQSLLPDPVGTPPIGPVGMSLADNDGNPMVIPSWHRPELINYWAFNLPTTGPKLTDVRLSGLASNAMLLRRVLMRPNWLDHPNFTGSNPELAAITGANQAARGARLARMIYGPWDVDNDNDGVRDSIWIDFGAPVMAGPQGKLVKPLAAIMVVDMDGRLNVNAHGTLDLAKAVPDVNLQQPRPLAGGEQPDDTPRGSGFGPADISLESIFERVGFNRLLLGNDYGNGVSFPGRYGFGVDNDGTRVYRPGFVNFRDVMSQISLYGWPEYSSWTTMFATPPDLRARYGAGVNLLGQPIYEATLAGEVDSPNGNLIVDSPYELALSKDAPAGVTGNANLSPPNTPFAIAELERVLRVFDADAASLPSRLTYLSGVLIPGGSVGDLTDRLKFTTDSFDLPAPGVGVPRTMMSYRDGDPNKPTGFKDLLSRTSTTGVSPTRRLPRSLAELIEARVRAKLQLKNNDTSGTRYKLFPDPLVDAAVAKELRGIMRQLLAPELADGLRLNINRAFGNGLDDDGDGTVDEDGELLPDDSETEVWPKIQTPARTTAAAAYDGGSNDTDMGARFPEKARNFSNVDGSVVEVGHRELMARHLYVLALTLSAPADYRLNTTTGVPEKDAELARRLAQWSVNAVDFRDADSKMTLFEYDVDPFDGWDVDGVVGFASQDDDDPQRGLVIGTSRPEVLMTETLAWHDRRTDDSAQEDVYVPGQATPGQAELMKIPPSPGKEPDGDFDQLVRPRGAFFLELYNPWPSGVGASPELHVNIAQDPTKQFLDAGVNLSAVSLATDPTRNNKPSPVWRFAVYKRWTRRASNGDIQIVPVEKAAEWDPDHPDPAKRPPGSPERIIYLTNFDPEHTGEKAAFFTRRGNARVRPGRYLVIGSGEQRAPGVYETRIGDRKGARNPDDPNRDRVRRIELDTNANAEHRVRMLDADSSLVEDITAGGAPGQRPLMQAPAEATMLGQGAGQLNMQAAYPGDNSRCVTDVAIVDRVAFTDDVTGLRQVVDRRLTLSEPVQGYPQKFRAAEWSQTREEYRNRQNQATAIDVPLDGPIGGEEALKTQGFGEKEEGNWPSYLARMVRPGAGQRQWWSLIDPFLTQIRKPSDGAEDLLPDPGACYARIFLQRLADPQYVWNPEPGQPGHNDQLPVNPYVTVDSSSANLTVFNSRGNPNNGEEEDDSPARNARARFASHERGIQQYLTATQANGGLPPTLWATEKPSREQKDDEFATTSPNQFYQTRRYSPSLQREREMEAQLVDSNDHWFDAVPFCSLGFLNQPFVDGARQGEERQLAPDNPFPWFAWNNRPYMSSNELILVPRVRSSIMLTQFTTAEAPGGPAAQKPSSYTTPHISELEKDQPDADERPEFDHLENFFFDFAYDRGSVRAESAAVSPKLDSDTRGIPGGMYRLLDYIHTPSLFVGTQTWLNPSTTRFGAVRTGVSDPTDSRWFRQPPFNSISEFRDPGRVNLNTVFSSGVWEGLQHGNSDRDSDDEHAAPDFNDEWVPSRRGYVTTNPADNNKTLVLDPLYPTFFANPLRPPDAAEMVPPLVADPTKEAAGDANRMVRAAVDVTLLRSIQGRTMSSIGTDPTPQADGEPLFSAETEQEYNDARRHPLFRYKPMTRLDNLVTTRSNVYAIWVTIGFFEVESVKPWTAVTNKTDFGNIEAFYKKVYPDGYMLGKEDGVDFGETRRLRGFYIIDRTLPAGFEPGVDHNVENVVRLRRRIE